ncbi:sulfur carrier protein ThiS [Rhodoferax sp.]|uniref:sulfur carrier protein ThiS n=1 Tax=Rhodoferax sp. TaxID=50421 RepID=UPI00260191C1|nr:sulfur carrier protein ThiS [Rhodoferax sp.]MDD2926945.1 sulfur carrier protein ThiS [Rhodoferax sp.]
MTTAPLKVWVNNTPLELPGQATLADAVAQFGIRPPFAAAVNLRFVPNTRYPQTPLSEGDRVDLIGPVTGG